MKKILLLILMVALIFIGVAVIKHDKSLLLKENAENIIEDMTGEAGLSEIEQSINPLSIQTLRDTNFEGSDIAIEETLEPGSNYNRYLASYISEGNKIFALLTVPTGSKPESGWPVIVFNHGYIPPKEYSTTERYLAYTDAFSTNGYIVFKSDYRGHGNSEGEARGGYGSNDYVIDVLNGLASVKKYKDSDPDRIGMYGHSMGGYITLRSMVVNKDIKAGVIWAGVVGSYPDLLTKWDRRYVNPPPTSGLSRGWRDLLTKTFGDPTSNKEFWDSISANSYLADISGPLQLHHGTGDTHVPIIFSETLDKQLRKAGKIIEYYIYEGDDHNLTNNLSLALNRSVDFFDQYLK